MQVNIDKFEIGTKLRRLYIMPKKNISLPFERCYTVLPWPWFIIYMLTLFTGYADYIFHVISNFHIQRSRFGRKCDKLDGYSKNSWTLQGSWGLLFATAGDPWHLVEPGQHQVSRGVVVRIVEGKLRAKALLNPALMNYNTHTHKKFIKPCTALHCIAQDYFFLCLMPYVLCFFVFGVMSYVLWVMSYVLCLRTYFLCPMSYVSLYYSSCGC